MKKVKLQIEENLRYTRFMTIEVDSEISDDHLNNILDNAQRKSEFPDELSYSLEKQGIKVLKDVDSDLSSPDNCEIEIIEIIDYNEIKEDKL